MTWPEQTVRWPDQTVISYEVPVKSSGVFGVTPMKVNDEPGLWMPEDVAMELAGSYLWGDDAWRHCLIEEIVAGRERDYSERRTSLIARYEAATTPPPPKWETALRKAVNGPYPPSEHDLVAAVRAALAEEAEK